MGSVRRIIGFALVLGLVAAAGVVWWDRTVHRASSANPGMVCPPVVQAGHRVPLAAIGVHRVALIGDSIMEEASCAIAESLRDLGIRTSRHAVATTGLLTGPVDWVEATRQIVAAEKPDVVVAIFVGNYWPPPLRDQTGAPIAANSPKFFVRWQERARQVSEAVHAANASMYWVSPPPISRAPLNAAGRLFNGYRTIPGDHFVTSGRVLGGPNGFEVMEKETCGRRRTLRAPDTVHLTDDGARIYGQQIAHDLTSRWGILVTPRPC